LQEFYSLLLQVYTCIKTCLGLREAKNYVPTLHSQVFLIVNTEFLQIFTYFLTKLTSTCMCNFRNFFLNLSCRNLWKTTHCFHIDPNFVILLGLKEVIFYLINGAISFMLAKIYTSNDYSLLLFIKANLVRAQTLSLSSQAFLYKL
jgi:hypothetical protein